MATGLDMSLDDLIKINKTSNGRRGGAAGGGGGGFKGRGRGGGPGPARRLPNRAPERAAPYAMTNMQAPAMMWQPGLLADPVGGPLSIETGTKLYISNLDYGVSNEDIKELFSEVGDLKRYSIHYDKSGRSKGTAEVVFSRQSDALAAVRRYNNVQLDGKPMKIEIVGNNMVSPGILPVPPPVNGAFGFPNGVPRSSGRGRDTAGGRSFGGRGSVRGRGRGRGRGHNEKFSAEDLDAELVKYHTEATQTN